MVLSVEGRLLGHRARKAEKGREWMGAGSSRRMTTLLSAPTIIGTILPPSAKLLGDTGKTLSFPSESGQNHIPI